MFVPLPSLNHQSAYGFGDEVTKSVLPILKYSITVMYHYGGLLSRMSPQCMIDRLLAFCLVFRGWTCIFPKRRGSQGKFSETKGFN